MARAARKPPSVWFIGFILASGLSAAAEEPPRDLVKRVARAETATRAARDEYTYRQSVTIEELDDRGARRGQYRETREVIFTPRQERIERMVGTPFEGLKRLVLTEEDFHDIREIQPFVLTEDQLWNYETKFRGEEIVDGVACWVLQVRPRQILAGQRLFDGLLWVGKEDYGIVRMEGRAVPQIHTAKSENLFPRFTTIRRQVDGKHWFPVHTHADDTLPFRTGPQRIRLTIRYMDYKRFTAESTVTFER